MSTAFVQVDAEVSLNQPVARDTYRIRLQCAEIARRILPGQFVMLRIPGTTDPLLGRPFAVYDTVDEGGETVAMDVVYLVVGKMTSRLTEVLPGGKLEMVGPLGNGFTLPDRPLKIAMVAGGIGQTPFLALANGLRGARAYGGRRFSHGVEKLTLYYGVRTHELAAGLDDFAAAGVEVKLSTDDGSAGYRGYVTDLLRKDGPPDLLYGCGPEPMLHALTRLAKEWNVRCEVSLETPMACGVGICFSCVSKVKTEQGWDYRRVCVDGPVFDANTLEW